MLGWSYKVILAKYAALSNDNHSRFRDLNLGSPSGEYFILSWGPCSYILTFLLSQQLNQRASDLETREPVHYMNIQLHRLDEPEPVPDDQHAMNIMKRRELPEEEVTGLEVSS